MVRTRMALSLNYDELISAADRVSEGKVKWPSRLIVYTSVGLVMVESSRAN